MKRTGWAIGWLLAATLLMSGCGNEDIAALPEASGTSGVVGGFVANTTFEAEGTAGWSTSGLWHLSARRSVSAPNAMWYGDEALGTFDVGASLGDLSRTVDLTGISGVEFDFYLDGECAPGTPSSLCFYDALSFGISTDGGATWTLLFDAPDTAPSFQHALVDLSAYSGSTVMLRFHFDSGDAAANAYEGAFIDNILFYQ